MRRKFVMLIASVVVVMSYCYLYGIYGISVREYLQEHGNLSIEDGILDLSHKNITNLEGLEDVPNKDSILVLDLSKNKIQIVSAEMFAYFSQLRELNLSSNKIQALPANVFEHLAQLSYLHLQFNRIKVLPENIFVPVPQLKTLDLSWNEIKVLPEDIFAQLVNLGRLNLGDNKLHILPENIFKNLAQVQILELQGNQLRVLPAGLFAGLDILLLDLARNYFKETTHEFSKKYLISILSDVELNFKDKKQEFKERVQQDLFDQISLLTMQQKKEQRTLIEGNAHWFQDQMFWYYYDCDYEVPIQDAQGNTVLHKAVILCNPLLVKVLVTLFSRLLTVKNSWGQTPLHTVMTLKNKAVSLAMTKILLAESQHPELLLQIEDNAGDTPLQVAISTNNYKVLQFLLAFGQEYKSGKLDYLLKQPDVGRAFEKLRRVETR